MQPSSAKPSSASPSSPAGAPSSPAGPTAPAFSVAPAIVRRATAIVALLAVALWLGGLLALGAIAAPVVFAIVPLPASADAMTVVFRRFDIVALASALLVLGAEAVSFFARFPFAAVDRWRVAAGAVASVLAMVQAWLLTPRIAALHDAGAARGVGADGMELARLHDLAEGCGKIEVVLLVAVVVLQVVALSARPPDAGEARPLVG